MSFILNSFSNSLMIHEEKTKGRVFPQISKLVLKTRLRLVFFNPPLSVWISDATLILVFDILRKESMFIVQTLIIADKFIATSSSRQNGAGSEFGADPTHI